MELKKLIDEMFEYFNVFNKKMINAENKNIKELAEEFSLSEELMDSIYNRVLNDAAVIMRNVLIEALPNIEKGDQNDS